MRDLRDGAVPVGVMAIIGMMVFPLPIGLLDLLLVGNLALAIMLLLSALSLAEPERFTALPTILLLSTLFRLALNIATTRQLLGKGEAPEVVAAFGAFVVGGDLVVGTVIFLIITLVQFLVIAKGAERVAEVAARFTLDAMPGKQMAIDADIRAGILSLSDAREKRRELQRESRLYGALDGAMKFVKGDAIAGLIITAVNIVGGFIIGIVQHGLDIVTALHRYTLFTIGDGLVSQVPALLTAVAAGIAVTRVGDRDGGSLGRDLFAQIGREPETLSTAGLILGALACTPGLPAIPLLALGGMLVIGAGGRKRSIAAETTKASTIAFRPSAPAAVTLRLGTAAGRALHVEGAFLPALRELKEEFYHTWGIFLGEVDGALTNAFEPCAVEILVRGVPSRSFLLDVDSGSACSHGASSASDRVIGELRSVLNTHRAELVDDLQTRALLEIHEPGSEALINTVTTKFLSVTNLTKVLRELVSEGIPVHAIPVILQAIAEHQSGRESGAIQLPSDGRLIRPECGRRGSDGIGVGEVSEPDADGPDRLETGAQPGELRFGDLRGGLYDAVRFALRRQIVATSLSDAAGQTGSAPATPRVWRLARSLDHTLTTALLHGAALHPELVRRMSFRLDEIAGECANARCVVLSSQPARSMLSRVVNRHQWSVLAYEEVEDSYRLSPRDVPILEIGAAVVPRGDAAAAEVGKRAHGGGT